MVAFYQVCRKLFFRLLSLHPALVTALLRLEAPGSMPKTTRLVKSIIRLLLPAAFLLIAAVISGSVWLVYSSARPYRAPYLVTPQKFGQLSSRAAQVTEETWTNRDGSSSRGWLLRGTDGSPAVILYHKYGADRSYVLNLGVKLNESTNFTVLMPDLRGHGEKPAVENASFGGCEAEDAGSALEFLRGLRTVNGITLVGKNIGIYGVEMGASVALIAASRDKGVKALALDSVPESADSILSETVERRYPFASSATAGLAKLGTRLYFFDGCYQRQTACDTARQITDRNILLLAGIDAAEFQSATSKLAKCLSASNRVQTKLDLSPSGFRIINASMEQSEAYDQRLIDFFRDALGS
jgi:pimeloyl-ACP methyl ester carboxylesterase